MLISGVSLLSFRFPILEVIKADKERVQPSKYQLFRIEKAKAVSISRTVS